MLDGAPAGARRPQVDHEGLYASALDALQQLLSSAQHQDGAALANHLAQLLASILSDAGNDMPSLSRYRKRSFVSAVVERTGADIAAQAIVKALPNTRLLPQRGIADVLSDLGPLSTRSIPVFRSAFVRFGFSDTSMVSESIIAEILYRLLCEAGELSPATDFLAFVPAVASLGVSPNWAHIIRSMDEFAANALPEAAQLPGLAAVLNSARRNGHNTVINGLWGRWRHQAAQLSLIRGLLAQDSDVFDLASWALQPVVSPDDVSGNATVHQLAISAQSSPWNSFELIETLSAALGSEDPQVRATVTDLLEKAVKEGADLVLLGLVQIEHPWSKVHTDLAAKLCSMFLSGHPSHQLVFTRLWQIDRKYLLNSLRTFYTENPSNLSRILDVAQDLRILDIVLDMPPFHFALDVASLASRREYLNLGKWLQDHIAHHGAPFIRACLEFLDSKTNEELASMDAPESAPTTPLTVYTVAIFLRVLRSHGDDMKEEDVEYFKVVRNLCLQLHPRLMNLAPGTENQEPGMQVVSFSSEVQEEADDWYRQMYSGKISVDDVIALLKKTKASSDPHDAQLFACMVHTLFDEYRCLEVDYPPRELSIAATVFGSLIQYELIDYIPLGIAIRYVLDALRHPQTSNLFSFGVQALKRFAQRLAEWPQLGQALLAIPHVGQSQPEILEMVHAAMKGEPVSQPDQYDSPFTAIQVDPISEDAQKTPDEGTSDKILFIVNNLAPSNLEAKLADAKQLLTPDIYHWFCSYLVLQRVSIEPNNHALYAQFLDGLDGNDLLRHVLRETLAKIKMLLNSEQTMQSSNERTLLKNLGSWLGSLTLAKNKPVRHRHIAFKELLVQGHQHGRLIVAIPFVCKVLEQCAKSTAFQPPNPWLMAVLSLLVELYTFADLKLNLKFEIEVLCKTLNIDIKDIKPTQMLNAPRSDAANGLNGQVPPEQQQQELVAPESALSYSDSLANVFHSLADYIVIGPQLALFASNPTLKRMICVAVERAVREIIAPVVERSVTIAAISTRELVTKDFALEGDDSKVKTAAHQMARNLAGSLALVTCKEPLRISMITHARTIFLASGFTEQTLPEQALVIIMQDNLEMACSIIEKAAMEKAIPEVDEGLANAYSARKDHQARGRGYFWDVNCVASSRYAATLPELLHLPAEGLLPAQLRVYDDFGHLPFVDRSAGDVSDYPLDGPHDLDFNARDLDGPVGPIQTQQAIELFSQAIAEMDKHTGASDEPLAAIPQDHELRAILRRIPIIAARCVDVDEAALAFSQKLVQLLYKSTTVLSRETLVILLERLCEVSVKAAKEVTAWLVYAEDERKFNVPVTIALIRAGLINIVELDSQLAKLSLREFRPSVIQFAAELAHECLREPACATRGQLQESINALQIALQRGKATDRAIAFLDELADGNLKARADISNTAMREQLAYCFAEWVRLFQHSPNAEKSFIDFVTQLQTQGILKGEEISSMFFRVCTEVSVDSYIKQKAIGGSVATGVFAPIDAFSKLVVLMIKYHADPSGANKEQAKVHYLTKILSIIVLVLAQSHEELGAHFQQKPFYRIFSSLLHDLSNAEASLQAAYHQSLAAISNTLNTLQPIFFPGFAFSWMSLLSHRILLPHLLAPPQRSGWPSFYRLLASLLRFMSPFLRSVELRETSRSVYRGSIRIFLVLLHDFPEFLAAYSHSLCDLIPTSAVQLRNIVLCAYPRKLRLPNPMHQGLNLNMLPEARLQPDVMPEQTLALDIVPGLKNKIDFAVNESSGTDDLVDDICDAVRESNFGRSKMKSAFVDRVPVLNAIVFQIGLSAIERVEQNGGSDHGRVIFQRLVERLDPEGSYLLLSSMANHLRYPSTHTAYFSTAFITLYGTGSNQIREQILRILLERIIVSRPHPWGVLYTMSELLRNSDFDLPPSPAEIERILQHLRDGLATFTP